MDSIILQGRPGFNFDHDHGLSCSVTERRRNGGGNQALSAGINQLVILGTYTNEALFHNAQQNDTMICLLEQISKNTCGILNEAVVQTRLQTAIKINSQLLADLYAATHADAALERQRLEQLQAQIEQCCPPTPLPPACTDKPCDKPNRLGKPPKPPKPGSGPLL